jgi:apolipoprotein D and lipocalin family protein
MTHFLKASLAVVALCIAGCTSVPHPPLTLAGPVDLNRFMGDWYVIAHIPTFIEREATEAVESYQLDADGSIATTFRFRKGDKDGPAREYHPRGFVVPGTDNAVWRMQFVWPIKADYRIIGLAPDYRWTIIGREARDYVWLMARTPQMADADVAEAMRIIAAAGYASDQLRQVPQSVR